MGRLTGSKRKRGAPTRAAKCTHSNAPFFKMRDELGWACSESDAQYRRCQHCGETLPLGSSNDGPEAVRVEMRAAEIPGMARGVPGEISGEDEVSGWIDHFTRADIWSDEDPQKWHAGWLAHEMQDVRITTPESVNHDADAWPWDPTRPIAGQYELHAQAEVEERRAAANTAALVADLNARGLAYDAINDAFDAEDAAPDAPLTVSIDSGAVQIGNLYHSTAVFDPDQSEELSDLLLLGADAARQAAQDGYHGPAVVVELNTGEEPEAGGEFELVLLTCTALHGGECQPASWDDGPSVCVVPMRAQSPRATGAEVLAVAASVGMMIDDAHAILRANGRDPATAYEAARAAEPDCRDEDGPEVERLMVEVDRVRPVTIPVRVTDIPSVTSPPYVLVDAEKILTEATDTVLRLLDGDLPAEPRHCDDYIDDESQPVALRIFLRRARSPAHGYLIQEPYPKLFADHDGQRVRVVMASRLGDVGITSDLTADIGYQKRVAVAELANFGDAP